MQPLLLDSGGRWEPRVAVVIETGRRVFENSAVGALLESVVAEIVVGAFRVNERKVRFPSDTGIDCDPRPHLPGILRVHPEIRLLDIELAGSADLKLAQFSQQEVRLAQTRFLSVEGEVSGRT